MHGNITDCQAYLKICLYLIAGSYCCYNTFALRLVHQTAQMACLLQLHAMQQNEAEYANNTVGVMHNFLHAGPWWRSCKREMLRARPF